MNGGEGKMRWKGMVREWVGALERWKRGGRLLDGPWRGGGLSLRFELEVVVWREELCRGG